MTNKTPGAVSGDAIRAALDAYETGDDATARKLLRLGPKDPMPRSWVHCVGCGYPCCGNDDACDFKSTHRRR